MLCMFSLHKVSIGSDNIFQAFGLYVHHKSYDSQPTPQMQYFKVPCRRMQKCRKYNYIE